MKLVRPTITFDGQTGGPTKTFNTVIANSFISNKTYTSDADASDEFLLNRVPRTSWTL